ncbi:cas scaffolding protein family member 4 isoform X2 [Amia ocellicauda]|uniref:cas scaffolding protein family member 4 isoform X2 n=1 Tax=Amia ocellicauda TaxID=2972642 RepID=UPI0034645DFB
MALSCKTNKTAEGSEQSRGQSSHSGPARTDTGPGLTLPCKAVMFKPVMWESWLDSLFTKRIKNLLAKALYDNLAECSDELAFRKGDILTVIEQNVTGSHGWWKCSLHGQQGLAPANRLYLLSASQAEVLSRGSEVGCLTLCAEKPPPVDSPRSRSPQNIYQIPSIPRQSPGPAYEIMDNLYKVPSVPTPRGPTPSPRKKAPERTSDSPSKVCPISAGGAGCNSRLPFSPSKELYDVPTLQRRVSLFTVSDPRPLTRKNSLFTPPSELQKNTEKDKDSTQENVYAVPPSICQDPSYDIPVPSATEAQKRLAGGYSTLPNPRKSDWIYDVPVSPEKQPWEQGSPGMLPSQGAGGGAVRQLFYDTLPARIGPLQNPELAHSLYDIPNPHPGCRPSPGDGMPLNSEPALSQKKLNPSCPRDPQRGHMPMHRRGIADAKYDLPRGAPLREGLGAVAHPLYDVPAPRDALAPDGEEEGEEKEAVSCQLAKDSQRSSTASTCSTSSSSSASSCDSLTLSSPSPEPLREVTLTQEEASKHLAELQEAVCQTVPRLMVFVSSRWRSKEHLGVHLAEIRMAAEEIADSITHFLSFAADVRGNARRLTDANLQARLQKQLAIVADSGLILRQAVAQLTQDGWQLDALAQDPCQAPPPDQLDRFVMVARTVPEDVRRLVSILNANGKLLFRAAQKEAEVPEGRCQSETKMKCALGNKEAGDSGGEDSDYVQLQRKEEFEQQQKTLQENRRLKFGVRSASEQQVDKKRKPVSWEHCRLYFGALQRAIGAFVKSVVENQPPEVFIGHSKLVIMVGQRLVDTLCREAHSGQDSQDLLCKSSHLCALLKQLAVATKKAALHFPETAALQEVEDFAKQLAQRAQHFRTTLDL